MPAPRPDREKDGEEEDVKEKVEDGEYRRSIGRKRRRVRTDGKRREGTRKAERTKCSGKRRERRKEDDNDGLSLRG